MAKSKSTKVKSITLKENTAKALNSQKFRREARATKMEVLRESLDLENSLKVIGKCSDELILLNNEIKEKFKNLKAYKTIKAQKKHEEIQAKEQAAILGTVNERVKVLSVLSNIHFKLLNKGLPDLRTTEITAPVDEEENPFSAITNAVGNVSALINTVAESRNGKA